MNPKWWNMVWAVLVGLCIWLHLYEFSATIFSAVVFMYLYNIQENQENRQCQGRLERPPT